MLVDFWTYTCINWIRTLPYVRAWSEKYKDQGLVVIGVHTPEFEFEKQTGTTCAALVSAMRVALSGGARQRLHGVACLQQQRLACHLSDRCEGVVSATAISAKVRTKTRNA